MRLKEDSSNWKASNIIRKVKQPPSVPIKRSRKDTKRWCKGKAGVEHEYEMRVPPNDSTAIRGFRRVPICINCSRQDYRGVEYWCRPHNTWDRHLFWGEHTHEA